jgi:hypothetical protein
MDFEDAQGRKRQRTAGGGVPPPPASSAGTNGVSPTTPVAVGADGTKQRLARARSDWLLWGTITLGLAGPRRDHEVGAGLRCVRRVVRI